MSKIVHYIGNLICLGLFCYFAYRVQYALNKLIQKKIGTTVSTAVSETRLFPSLSICFQKRNSTLNSILSDLDGSLRQARNDVLSSFVHHGLQKNG